MLFPSHVACYMPLSKKPAWVLPLRTLHKVSQQTAVRSTTYMTETMFFMCRSRQTGRGQTCIAGSPRTMFF